MKVITCVLSFLWNFLFQAPGFVIGVVMFVGLAAVPFVMLAYILWYIATR